MFYESVLYIVEYITETKQWKGEQEKQGNQLTKISALTTDSNSQSLTHFHMVHSLKPDRSTT